MFDLDSIKSLEDTQRSNFYRAQVISLDDPLNLNRIQINIFGLTDDIPSESLPWCELQFTAGFSTYPILNDIVWLFFEGGDIFRPVYLGTIYAGLDIDTDTGYEKFSLAAGSITESATGVLGIGYDFKGIDDKDSYRSALRTVNNVEEDKHLTLKDTISHYDAISSGNTWWRKFSGLDSVNTDDIAPGQTLWLSGVDPTYGKCPFKEKKVYPWYELRETNQNSWKSIYGGWRFFTETDLINGLGSFPDNIRRTYMKRVRNWANWTVWKSRKEIWVPESGLYKNAVPKSWNFIPMSVTLYSDPELFSVSFSRDAINTDPETLDERPGGDLHTEEMQGFVNIKPFPLGTMKIKNRKFYKQSTWMSYDGKSAIELDDNDNYERLRLDYNYSEGGLEFSRVGWHGLNIWTEGSFMMRAWGRQGNGKGEGMFVDSAIECIDHSLLISSNKALMLGGDSSASLTSLGPAGVRSKMNVTSITGGGGVVIQTEAGLSTREGVSDFNRGIWMGSPIIGGNGQAGGDGGMNGWMPVLCDKDKGEAEKYFRALNSVLLMVRKLASMCYQQPMVTDQYTAVPLAVQLRTWAIGAMQVVKDIKEGSLSAVSVMAGSEKINIEGAVKGK
jgi:hypothetical protein